MCSAAARSSKPELEPRGRAQVEADREGAQIGQLARGDRGDRAGIDAAGEVGADRHVADQLAAHGLAEQAIELLDVALLVDAASGSWKSKSQ